MENLKKEIKSIMEDLDTNNLTIECCDYKVKGTLLTHCYYDDIKDEFIFTSGDMVADSIAEEIILNDEQTKEVLELIVECYG